MLRDRRADLTGIELSCTNTNTVLPYVDLVLEVLEAVAADPDAPLVARQTRRSAAELRLGPEHHDPGAYDDLETDAYPWTLPFSLSAERLRVIMRQLGAPLAETMTVFADDPSASPTAAHLAETMGMGRGELQIVRGATAFPDAELPAVSPAAAWRLAGIAQWVTSLTGDVGQTLDRSALHGGDIPVPASVCVAQPAVGQALSDLIDRCLSVDPCARPRADAMAEVFLLGGLTPVGPSAVPS